MNKTSLSLIISFFVYFQTYSQITRKYAGIYGYGDSIPSAHLVIYPESDTTLLFYIWLIKVNYHIGQNAGRIIIKHDSAIYDEEDTTKGINCKLYFNFQSQKVIVKTIDGHDEVPDYGYGVISDGVYYKNNNKIPEYYIGEEQDTVYFKRFKKPR